MIHATAIVDGADIDSSTNVWAYAHVLPGARIGRNVNIGDHCFVEGGATIGNNVTLKNAVCVWEGVSIDDDVFVGPNVTFTNDRYPRSPRMQHAIDRYATRENWLVQTRLRRGCSIGAAAVIVPGVEIGFFATVAAGAVVTRNVAPFSLVLGNPARKVADVCVCGIKLDEPESMAICRECGLTAKARAEFMQQLENTTK